MLGQHNNTIQQQEDGGLSCALLLALITPNLK
jgi:hypothetical protein